MKKKTLLAVCSVTAAAALAFGLAACGDNGMTAEKAAEKIATFTTSPTVIDATFKQTYQLAVDSTNASFKAFEKDIADTVVIQADYTAGNVYYYGKKTAKDNSVTEQLVYKDGSTYYWMTTTSVKTALTDEAAAKTKINELMTSLSKETTGYVDGTAFTYNADWVNTYIMLGSNTVKGTESSYFTYTYDNADNDGLKIDIDMKYVGYYGDAGTFEFGTDATHTGATAAITTTSDGYITSFNETLNNHMEMAITSTPIPLDLTGTRSLTATYGGTLTKKTTITQDIRPATITVGTVANATVATYNFKQGDYSTLATPSSTVDAGNFVAVKVTPDTGYEVSSVTVNGNETQLIQGYYCYMTAAESGATYNVAVVVIAEGAEAPTTGTITVAAVEHATVATYNFKNGDYSTLATTSTIVDVGNYVAVKVTCDEGYVVDTVTVNGNATELKNGYYCLMQAATAGTTYNVVVTVKQTPGTIEVTEVANATVETYNFKLGDYSTLQTASTTVDVGNYVAVKVTCDAGYEVASVTVNGQATELKNGYYCLMQAATSGTTYTVVVTLRTASAS
jgi:hypothetical protein